MPLIVFKSGIKDRLKSFSLISSIFVALVGFVVLIGWTKDIVFIKSVSPDWISMKANTAFCFLLSGLTLTIFNIEKRGSGSHVIAYSFSAIIVFIATVTLYEYFYNTNVGIDEFFFKDNTLFKGTAKPGRIALGSAVCFILFGGSFLLSASNRISQIYFQWIYITSGFIAFTALLGYIFQMQELTGIAKHTTMAIHTSFSFLILMFASLTLRAEEGIMKLILSKKSGSKVFRSTFTLILFTIVIMGWFSIKGEQFGLFNHDVGLLLFNDVVIILFAVILYQNTLSINKSEEKIQQSENLILKSHSAANMGSFEWDINTGNWKSSKILDEIFGIDENYNRSFEGWVNLIHDDWRKLMNDYVSIDVIENSNKFDKEYKIVRHSDGQECWVHGLGDIEFNENGKPSKLNGIIFNISEQKKAEVKLVQLSQAIEQSPASVVITDTMGNIEYVNTKFSTVTGYAKEEALGKNPRILKSGFTSPAEYKNLWQTISSGKEWQGEMHNKKKNGELYWESASISPVLNTNGEIISYMAVKEDITEQKKLEQRFYAAFNSSPSAMSISHIDDRILLT